MKTLAQNKKITNIIIGINAFMDVIIFDQLLKWFVLKGIIPETHTGIVDITLVWNTGVAFGIRIPPLLWGILVVGICILLVSHIVTHQLYMHTRYVVAFSFIAGGALSNIIDRINHGAVVDFINFHFWPVFNLADTMIVIGALLFVIFPISETTEHKNSLTNTSD